MVRIKFTEQALDDLDQIAGYISRDSPKMAFLFIERIFQKVLPLQNHPKLGRRVPEFGKEELRELIYGRYRIVYKIMGDSLIDIIAVHHSAQKLSSDSLFD